MVSHEHETHFQGTRAGKPISDMTMTMALRRMDKPVTAHGFRTSFRVWAAEATSYAGAIAEAALAHTVRNKVEAAYRRTDFLEKRREMMQRWADHCEGLGNVVKLAITAGAAL